MNKSDLEKKYYKRNNIVHQSDGRYSNHYVSWLERHLLKKETTPRLAVVPTNKMGMGVFAMNQIKENELIEIAPFIKLGLLDTIGSNLEKYIMDIDGEEIMPTGFIPWYNHNDNPNAKIMHTEGSKYLRVTALRKIEANEQIFIKYVSTEEFYN